MGDLGVVRYVTSGFALVALIVVSMTAYLRHRTNAEVRELESLPPKDRLNAMARRGEKPLVDASGFGEERAFKFLLEQLYERRRRQTVLVGALVVLTALAIVLGTIAPRWSRIETTSTSALPSTVPVNTSIVDAPLVDAAIGDARVDAARDPDTVRQSDSSPPAKRPRPSAKAEPTESKPEHLTFNCYYELSFPGSGVTTQTETVSARDSTDAATQCHARCKAPRGQRKNCRVVTP